MTAVGLTLSAPDTIPSGWTTFRFANQSNMVHFAVVERMPEGRDLVDQQEIVAPIALYPDSLLTQVLMASTYPLEVVEAQRWVSQNLAA